MSSQKVYYFSPDRLAFYDTMIPGSYKIDSTLAQGIISRLRLGHQLKINPQGQPYTVVPKHFQSDIGLLYQYKIETLNSDYEVACDILRGEYPPTETVSFSLQLLEAVQYKHWMMSDRTGPEPLLFYIDKLSDSRTQRGVGEGLEDLVNRILYNSTVYNTGMGMLTAYRHSLEKELKVLHAARKPVLLETKSWDFVALLKQMGL